MKVYIFCYKRKKGSKAKSKRLHFSEIHKDPYYAMQNIEKVKSIIDNYRGLRRTK